MEKRFFRPHLSIALFFRDISIDNFLLTAYSFDWI
jgi:hypothetical protein